MGNNLSISVKNNLSILIEINDLQAKNDLQNPMKTNKNQTNNLISQTPLKSAVGRNSQRDRKSKKMFFIAANSRFCRKKWAYDSKTFDKKKTSIVNKIIDKIKKSKIYQKTIIDLHKKQWKKIIWIQLLILINENIWMKKILSKNKNLIIIKWMFKIKYQQNDIVEKFKTCLIVRNFIQKYDINYKKTFASILQYENLKNFIFFIIQFRFHMH